MDRHEMLKKISELLEMVDLLTEYGLYSENEKSELINQTLDNFKKISNVK